MMQNYIAKLLDEYEQIASNQISRFEPGLTFEQFKDACDEMVANLTKLRKSTEKILKDQLYPTLDNIEKISNEEETELYAAAQKLSSFEMRKDPGLAFKIYSALLKRARVENDDAKILKYLYWCGITQFFFYGQQDNKILEYFEEGAAYADMYDSFEDPEIRQYVHRCLGNVSMVLYTLGDPKDAIAKEESNFNFWNKLIFSGKDPDFPWLNYFLNGYNHRHMYLTKKVHKDPESETKANLREILDVSMTINKLYHQNDELYSVFGGTRYDYHLWEAQFLSGLISFDNLVENIEKRRAELDPDDYSADAMYVRIQLNSYMMFYASTMSKLRDRRDEIVSKTSKDSIDYLSSIPKTVSTETAKFYLRSLAKSLSIIFDPVEQFEFILKMTTYRHIPTYAHSIMVGKIAALLTKLLIDRDPGYFVGCLGISNVDEVRERTGEICDFAEKSGLCHDIGKIAGIENPYIHIRVLTDEEFEIIKEHPDVGASMMKREDGATVNEGFIEVIGGHHKFYDNSSGYPGSFDVRKSKYRTMIDIIAVSNSIFASTDPVSRTYEDVKTLETVCYEIQTGAGIKYSPVIAAMLDDETVYLSIQKLLDEESLKAYYTAYLYA